MIIESVLDISRSIPDNINKVWKEAYHVDIRLLKYFLAVAKYGNITRAAEQLHVTQPTISRQLMELEETVGSPLLIRGKRQVTLTEAGVLFQQRAEEIVSLMEKTLRDITDQDDLLGGTVAVGCVETCVSRMLAKALKGFSRQYPKVQYDLYSGTGDDIREKLDQGELDFGILVEPAEVAKYDFFVCPIRRYGGCWCARMTPWPKSRAWNGKICSPVHLSCPGGKLCGITSRAGSGWNRAS